jgi:hypothetical protein
MTGKNQPATQGVHISSDTRMRGSVLECSRPLELFAGLETFESAGGPAHSRTLSRSKAVSSEERPRKLHAQC